MSVDDRPAHRVWTGPDWREDPQWRDDSGFPADRRTYFDDVVDVICPEANSRGPRYGYGAGPRPDQAAGNAGRHAARHGRGRRVAGNRTGVAALAVTAVVGTGVGAGVLGVVPFMPPTTTSPGVTTSAHHTSTASPAVRSGATAGQHTGYVGKHRRPDSAPSSSSAQAGAQTGTAPGNAGSSGGAAYSPVSSRSASRSAGAGQTGTSSSSGSSSSSSGSSSGQPAQQSPSPSTSPSSGGSSTGSTGGSGSGGTGSGGTGTTGSSGGSGSTSGSGNGGLVGGVVGTVTGVVGGLL